MKTTLHYQVKDFQRFVLEDLEKQGKTLAPGTEPMMADLENMDDPEQVVMEVLVEDRPKQDFNPVEITQLSPAALPAPTLVTNQAVSKPGRKYKQDAGLSEEELAKREAKRATWRKIDQAKRERKAAVKTDQSNARKIVAQAADPKPTYNNTPFAQRQETRQQVFEERMNQIEKPEIEEIKVKRQEVVAPAPAGFPTSSREAQPAFTR